MDAEERVPPADFSSLSNSDFLGGFSDENQQCAVLFIKSQMTNTKPRFVGLQFRDHGVLRLIQKDSGIDYKCFHSIQNSPLRRVSFKKLKSIISSVVYIFLFIKVKIVGNRRVASVPYEITLSGISSGLFSMWKKHVY